MSLRTWLGYILVDNLPEGYVKLRGELSDAAFWGEWNELFVKLKEGMAKYNQSWVNAIRMSEQHTCLVLLFHKADLFDSTEPLENADKMSFWTPLH